MDSTENIGISTRPIQNGNDSTSREESPEDIINSYLHRQILIDNGARFAENIHDRENCFAALSQATGVDITQEKEDAINKFFDDLRKDIKGDYNHDLDQTGDGVVNAKDLEKIFKEA